MVTIMSRLFQHRDDYEAMKKAIEDHDAVVFIKVAKVIDLMITVLRDLDLIR